MILIVLNGLEMALVHSPGLFLNKTALVSLSPPS